MQTYTPNIAMKIDPKTYHIYKGKKVSYRLGISNHCVNIFRGYCLDINAE